MSDFSSYSVLDLTELSVQIVLVLMILSVLGARFLSPLKSLLAYGKTQATTGSGQSKRTAAPPSAPATLSIASLTAKIPFWNVPKDWFTYFYVLAGVLAAANCALAWGPLRDSYSGFGRRQIATSLVCVLGHDLRRLYECVFVQFKKLPPKTPEAGDETKGPGPERATMQLPHFLVGIAFYTAVNVLYFLGLAEGAADVVPSSTFQSAVFTLSLLLFGIASYIQHLCHLHLSQLVKYSLPSTPSKIPLASKIYEKAACAHYTAEILIYLSLWGLYPMHSETNAMRTVSWGLLVAWVAVNLSISAEQTLIYYRKNAQLGAYKDKGKVPEYAIVPFAL